MRSTRNVWSKDDVLQSEQFRFDLRLSLEDVQPGTSNLSVAYGPDKRFFIDDRAGLETGVYTTFDRGAHWVQLGTGLPPAPAYEPPPAPEPAP